MDLPLEKAAPLLSVLPFGVPDTSGEDLAALLFWSSAAK